MRQVYRLPLRQSQGFIDSLFRMMGLPLDCPNFSTLSKRLSELNITTPRYKKTNKPVEDVHAIAIDSTGLKRFGRGEWHNEKYELSRRLWRTGRQSRRLVAFCVTLRHCILSFSLYAPYSQKTSAER